MRLIVAITVLTLLATTGGCAQYRGTFTVLASEYLPGQYATVFFPRVTGEICMNPLGTGDNALYLAVEDALSHAPNANALALVRIRLENNCFQVEGNAVRLQTP